MKKKICFTLALVMVFSALSALPSFAAQLPLYDPDPFYTEEYIGVISDDGTNPTLEAQGYFGISTEEELRTAQGKVYLKNDIIFTKGSGIDKKEFTLDGNGHTIFFEGGFCIIPKGENITVKNLNLAGSVVIDKEHVITSSHVNYGPLISNLTNSACVLDNVHSYVNITVRDELFYGALGGIIGNVDYTTSTHTATFNNVSYTGSIDVNAPNPYQTRLLYVGGIAGIVHKKMAVTEAHVNADINVSFDNFSTIGGLFGKASSRTGSIENSSFRGSIKASGKNAADCSIGGIAGYIDFESFVANNLLNEGKIRLDNVGENVCAGGMFGRLTTNAEETTFRYLINSGSIFGVHTGGGICGEIIADKTLQRFVLMDIKNEADITASHAAGGLVGRIIMKNTFQVTRVYNGGNITVTATDANGAAGIFGFCDKGAKASITLTRANNSGEIAGVNPTPLILAEDTADNEAQNYYSNIIDGEHFGEYTDRATLDAYVNGITFYKIYTDSLTTALNEREIYNVNYYTEDSCATLSEAYLHGRTMLRDATKQYEITEAARGINDAINALVVKPLTADELLEYVALVREYDNYNSEDYTAKSFNKYRSAMYGLKKKEKTTLEARQSYDAVLEAKEGLVFIGELRELFQYLPKSEEECDSKEDWEIASYAIAYARLKYNAETQEEVDDAVRVVLDALLQLDNNEETIPPEFTLPTEKNTWEYAWSQFLAHQSESMSIELSGGGFTDDGEPDLGVLLGVGSVVLFAILAIGVGIVFRNKDD